MSTSWTNENLIKALHDHQINGFSTDRAAGANEIKKPFLIKMMQMKRRIVQMVPFHGL
jgi:hypothetical protein